MGNAPEPTIEQIGHRRWLLQQAVVAVDTITQPTGRGQVMLDAIFLAVLIWITARFELHAFLPGRIASSLFITIVGVSLLGGLYTYLIAGPLARRRRAGA